MGDSPIIGAGNYCDNRFGAAACTGMGELAIRLSTARTIISYMEKKGEIKKQYTGRLKKQLKEKGVRSFGSKKEDNYYFEHGNSQKAKSDG